MFENPNKSFLSKWPTITPPCCTSMGPKGSVQSKAAPQDSDCQWLASGLVPSEWKSCSEILFFFGSQGIWKTLEVHWCHKIMPNKKLVVEILHLLGSIDAVLNQRINKKTINNHKKPTNWLDFSKLRMTSQSLVINKQNILRVQVTRVISRSYWCPPTPRSILSSNARQRRKLSIDFNGTWQQLDSNQEIPWRSVGFVFVCHSLL